MSLMHKSLVRLLPLGVAVLLTACGGGGDDPITNGNGTSQYSSPSTPPPSGGPSTVSLTWDSPTTKVDQSCLTDLAGYKLYYTHASGGAPVVQTLAANSLTCATTGEVNSCGAVQGCTYTVNGLSSGTWSFVVTAYDNFGNESAFSNGIEYVVN